MQVGILCVSSLTEFSIKLIGLAKKDEGEERNF